VDFQQLFDKLKSLGGAMTRTQLVTLGVAFVLVVAVLGGSTWWLNSTDYALLFSDMDSETASQVVSKLKTLKVPFQLDPGGHAIRVASTRIDELRLELTSQGLPASGRIGFEIFDRTAFGATEFLEKVNYRRALEGEIARTIATISEVSSARVHIAMGKDSLFGEPRPAKASVVLKLRGQRPLATSTISGISNLVAASVEGLRPEAVVILDSFGRPLARPQEDANDPLGAAQLERQQRIERDMATRVVALLEPVVGEERVRVNVALKLNPASTEQTEERYDPNTVLRSKQTSSDVASGGQVPALVAGARGNMPPSADPKAPQAGTPAALATLPGSQRNAETSNFEVSRLTRHTIQPPGDIARLSVAVILDDDHVPQKQKDGSTKLTRSPRSREELQKIQGIVAAAVGLDASRGDQLTVENVAFDEPASEEGPAPSVFEKFTPQLQEGSKVVAVLLIVLFTFLLVVRPMLRTAGLLPEKKRKPGRAERAALKAAAKAEEAAAAAAAEAAARAAMPSLPKPRTVADLENEIEAQLEAEEHAKLSENRRLPVLSRRVSTMSLKEPENIAKLLRTWMQEGER
jgi:flagellar M-ring protein FliF